MSVRTGLAVLGAALLATAVWVTPAGAEIPDPAASAPAAAASVVPSPSVAAPGTRIRVTGAGWPEGVPIQTLLCGNAGLDGSGDCDSAGGGSSTTDASGAFTALMTINTPPKPCPCVIRATSNETNIVVSQPFTLTGADTAAPTQTDTSRQLEATLRLTGAGSNLGAWFGGAAKRTLAMTVTNIGVNPLVDPPVTLLSGKGSDPTTVLGQPKLGTIAPQETVEYELPVTFGAPTFGQYSVKAQFTGLDTVVEETASTSSYPWALIVIVWLLLQPLLLGLYKRRPTVEGEAQIESDPFGGAQPGPAAPVAAATAAVAAAGLVPDTAAPAAAVPVAAAAGGGVVAVAPGATSIAVRQPTPLVPGYQPVFGVADLRTYLDPSRPAERVTVAPRIVLGGVIPQNTAPPTGGPAAEGPDPRDPLGQIEPPRDEHA